MVPGLGGVAAHVRGGAVRARGTPATGEAGSAAITGLSEYRAKAEAYEFAAGASVQTALAVHANARSAAMALADQRQIGSMIERRRGAFTARAAGVQG